MSTTASFPLLSGVFKLLTRIRICICFVATHTDFYDFTQERIKFYDLKEDARKTSVRNYGELRFFPDELMYKGLRSNVWPQSWKRFMVDFMLGRGLTMLYPNFNDESGYATTLQLGGEHTGEDEHGDAGNIWPTELQISTNARVCQYLRDGNKNAWTLTYPKSLAELEVSGSGSKLYPMG